MNIAVIGCGYVGSVTGACLAAFGHRVLCLDVDPERVAALQAGLPVLQEPGLAELCAAQVDAGRLAFTTDPAEAVPPARAVFLCVGTPAGRTGAPDLRQLRAAAATIGPLLAADGIVVTKSTVPVGCGDWLRTELEEARGDARWEGAIVSNPEFLREGSAVHDFLYPDRIVLGGDDLYVDVIASLLAPIMRRADATTVPLHRMDRTSAEMVKYAANAALATKISFANEIASLCEATGADARLVLPAVGGDGRIGPAFLDPGLGWGGSCLPKDTAALVATGREYGVATPMLDAARTVNDEACRSIVMSLRHGLRTLRGRRIGMLGLTFKAGTDDVRGSPAVRLARALTQAGARVRAFDPAVPAAGPAAGGPRSFHIVGSAEEATARADAVVVATGWPQFGDLDLEAVARAMRGDLLIDARGVIDPRTATGAGLRLVGIGWTPRPGGVPDQPTSASSVSLPPSREGNVRSAVG